MGAAHSRRLLTLFVLVLVLALGAALPGRAAAAEPGVVADLTWFPPEADRVKSAAAIADLGSKWTRIDIGWRDFEPQRGAYNSWSVGAYRTELQRARAAGQKVVVMVATAPEWASGSSNANAAPRDPADYARFLDYLGRQYGQYVDAWEVWNEPNYSRFWPSGPNPAQYAALLKAAYPAVKAADPTAKVLFGGLSTNDYKFLEGAYAAGAKGSFDVLATHPYSCRSPETVVRGSDGRMTRDTFSAYRELRASMAAAGDLKPIWFTEFGWSTTTASCGVSEATQADYLTRAYELAEQDPYVEVGLWYNLRNNFWAADADSVEARYGLLATDFRQKPSYAAFKAYAAGQPAPAPAPEPTPAPAPKKKPRGKAFTTTTSSLLTLSVSSPPAGASSSRSRRTLRAFGRVRSARIRRVRVVLRRGAAGRIVHARTAKVRRGRFSVRLRGVRRGRWMVAARASGDGARATARRAVRL
jgi:hypothetical protein